MTSPRIGGIVLPERKARAAFTLVEALVALVIITIVGLTATAYIAESRVREIHEWHEANALYLAEREVESWQGTGYNGLEGWSSGDVVNASTPNATTFLPFGYSPASPDPAWNTTGRFKPVALDGFQYRIRAQMLYTASSPAASPTDFYIEDSWNNGTGIVVSRYRLIRVVVQWGRFTGVTSEQQLMQETRIAR
jgi:type II secretory pathway pseudopilin PulG